MIAPANRCGPRGSLWTVVSLSLVALVMPGYSQERPKQDEFARFEQYRNGTTPVDAGAKDLFDKVAKFFVGQLTDPGIQKEGMHKAVSDLGKRLLLPPTYRYQRLSAEQKKFVDEFGKSIAEQIDKLLAEQSKPLVRINAMRMAAEVGRSGCDAAAEVALKSLEKANESDAVKLYALKTIANLFEVEPEPEVQPARTVFQKRSDLQQTPLEQRCIQALIAYIMHKPDLPEGASPGEIDAIRYIRCEAVRGLGFVRVQSVKKLGQVQARPALVLLKVSRSDGLTPPTDTKERVAAIVGFCRLLFDKDRDLQLDYAVYHLGQAICELVQYKNDHAQDVSIPWKAAATEIQFALENWYKGADYLKLEHSQLIKEFIDLANVNVLQALAAGQAGNTANVEPLRAWLMKMNLGPTASLFKSDPTTKLDVK